MVEVDVDGEIEVECECPKCKTKFMKTVHYYDTTEIDLADLAPDRDWWD